MTRIGAAASVASVLLTAGCSDTGTGPSVPPVSVSCPASASATSQDGRAVAVSFAAPVASGGQAPLTTTCAPESGTLFTLGQTLVRCTSRDVARRSAECAFSVTVERPPQLRLTSFLAFGDSITAGVLAQSCPVGGGVNCSVTTPTFDSFPFGDDLRWLYPRIGEESVSAYPRQLAALLGARYPGQSLTMSNQGFPGEFVEDGRDRLPQTLTANRPQVLLLQEGANDLNQRNPTVAGMVDDMRTMIRDARGRGIDVFVGTALPQRPNACRGYDFCDGTAHAPIYNNQLRSMITAEGAVLVDLYPLFDGRTSTLLGLDGLHPNDAGYKVMADAFFNAIRQRLEN